MKIEKKKEIWRWDRGLRLRAMQRRLSGIKHLIKKLRKGKIGGAGVAPDSSVEETVGVIGD